jgi:VWFA-related protein
MRRLFEGASEPMLLLFSAEVTMLRRRILSSPAKFQVSLRLSAVLLACAAFTPFPFKAQQPPSQEISTREVEPTFTLKAETNLVLVRVVVRDAKGAAVDSLRQEDFQLFDRGKLQSILHFSLEKPAVKGTETLPQRPAERTGAEARNAIATATPAAVPRRFVALYFDDVNTPFASLARARDAADRFIASSIQPGDRVALYTASGQKQLDFTGDVAQMHQALLDLRARPVTESSSRSCGAIPPYEAYLIATFQDATAIAVATDDILNCDYQGNAAMLKLAQSKVQTEAVDSLARSETQASAGLRGIQTVVNRMTSLPGQRSVVIVSGGFLTDTLRLELDEIADRALRAGITLSALDARGLYTDAELTDLAHGSFSANTTNPAIMEMKRRMLQESARRQTDGVQILALDTGGVFINNNNDLAAGFRRAADLPEAYYLLAFSPQNLKPDGAFHPLQVKLVSARGFSLQARHGYYAPKKSSDPNTQEKEEIQEAVFSQDETHDLPVDVHTQFFMKTESDASISVQTILDVRQLHLRKEGDRNLDNLIFVTALFDQDGHVVSAQQRSVELRLRDSSLATLLQTGISIETLFDVKPGNYMVRAIVCDSASGQISGLNRTVEIPY